MKQIEISLRYSTIYLLEKMGFKKKKIIDTEFQNLCFRFSVPVLPLKFKIKIIKILQMYLTFYISADLTQQIK